MKINPAALEAAIIDSWRHMKRDDPIWDFNLTSTRFPEVIDAHRKLVTAMFETGCDPLRAITRATDGKISYADMFESGQKWNKALAEYLKQWAGKHGLT